MATPPLLAVAPEIKLEVISHIKRPSDLKNICLVNKELRDLAAQRLFRYIKLDIEVPLKDTTRNALGGRSARYIRHLFLQRKGSVNDLSPALESILNLLPKNILFSIRLSRKLPLPFEAFLRLCTTQTTLRSVVLQDFKGYSTTHLDSYLCDGISKMKQVRALSVRANIESWAETCTVAQKFIQAHPTSLKKLSIMPAGHWMSARDPSIYKPNANVGPVFETLFKHAIDTSAYQPLTLTHLTLDNVSLDASNQSILGFVDFTLLSQLRIRRCVNTVLFLSTLTDRNLNIPFSLTLFEFAEFVNDDIAPLQNFLQSFKGLEQLYIVLRHSKSQPSVQSVANHAASLKTLLVDCTVDSDEDPENGSYSSPDFDDLMSACSQLEELGMNCPEEVEYPDSSILSLSRLSRISVLNIKPGVSYEEFPTPLTWECAALRLAGQIFEKVQTDVVAIGSCSENLCLVDAEYDFKVERQYYVRAEKKDALGRTSICAAEVELHQLQYNMPKSELLKYRSPWFYRPGEQV